MTASATATAPIHWYAVAPPENLAVYLSAMALVHSNAYGEAIVHGERTREALRAAVDRHYLPMLAAFTAAAALRGWDPDQITDTVEDGAGVHEWCWQWLTEAGIQADVIDRLTWDLNATGVLEALAKVPVLTGP